MKSAFRLLLLLFFFCQNINAQNTDYPLTAVNIRDVKLTDKFWLPKVETIQSVTIPYSFKKCEQEGRMENFLIAGGKLKGKVRGKMPFDDTDLYKIIEGAAYSLISHPNAELDKYLDSVISIIKIGQEPDGYITTWFTIDRTHPPADWVKPSKERWENEISSHELYNSGHLFEAAAAHYIATGKRNFLDIAIKNADLLVKNFGPGKLQKVPGHQIVETGLIKLYRITGNIKYLELAKFFLDQRGNKSGHELYGEYNQDHLPVISQDEVVGHAVRGVYMYSGMTDIAALYNDSTYLKAVNNLWENMVYKKLYITGGIGAKHDGEAFGENYELPNLTAYGETCAAIGSVYWNYRLFMLTGSPKYYDIIERTLYNGLVSGISLDGTKFFYCNPLESDGKYQFNMGACTRQSWFDCSCCPTNLIRFIPSVPGLIYAVNKDSIYINLFIANSSIISLQNNSVNVSLDSEYPLDGKVKITVNPDRKEKFTLKIRVPYWATEHPVPGSLYQYADAVSGSIELKINGKDEKPFYSNGYIEITKEWENKDQVEISFPMEIRRVKANNLVAADKGLTALEYGPIVYCAEEIDNVKDFTDLKLPGVSDLKIEKRNDLLNGINIISSVKDSKQIMIPYYSWSNRGADKMRLWFP